MYKYTAHIPYTHINYCSMYFLYCIHLFICIKNTVHMHMYIFVQNVIFVFSSKRMKKLFFYHTFTTSFLKKKSQLRIQTLI